MEKCNLTSCCRGQSQLAITLYKHTMREYKDISGGKDISLCLIMSKVKKDFAVSFPTNLTKDKRKRGKRERERAAVVELARK